MPPVADEDRAVELAHDFFAPAPYHIRAEEGAPLCYFLADMQTIVEGMAEVFFHFRQLVNLPWGKLIDTGPCIWAAEDAQLATAPAPS